MSLMVPLCCSSFRPFHCLDETHLLISLQSHSLASRLHDDFNKGPFQYEIGAPRRTDLGVPQWPHCKCFRNHIALHAR